MGGTVGLVLSVVVPGGWASGLALAAMEAAASMVSVMEAAEVGAGSGGNTDDPMDGNAVGVAGEVKQVKQAGAGLVNQSGRHAVMVGDTRHVMVSRAGGGAINRSPASPPVRPPVCPIV